MPESLRPFYNPGPGEIIKDAMDELGWSQQDLADILGMTLKSINLILNNKQSITPETATLLGKVFSTSAEMWMNLEARYQLRKVKETSDGRFELARMKSEINRLMPLAEVRQKGWTIYDTSTIYGIKGELQRVFGTYRYLEITEKLKENSFCARKKRTDDDCSFYYCNSWFAYAKLLGCNQDLPKYDKEKLQELTKTLHLYTTKDDGVGKFIAKLKECGVGFFVLSHLKRTYLDGASFIHEENPYIVYTGRYDRTDNFWFVLSHEISHILLHFNNLKEPHLDNLDQKPEEETEVEADAKASEILRSNEIVNLGTPYSKYLAETRLVEIAGKTEVSPALVVGILQHNKVIDYRRFSKYKTPVLKEIDKDYIIG